VLKAASGEVRIIEIMDGADKVCFVIINSKRKIDLDDARSGKWRGQELSLISKIFGSAISSAVQITRMPLRKI